MDKKPKLNHWGKNKIFNISIMMLFNSDTSINRFIFSFLRQNVYERERFVKVEKIIDFSVAIIEIILDFNYRSDICL
jgi:hypothetical protein